jgi:hypothetical protein
MAVSIADQFEILPTIPRRTVYVLPVFDYYITELPARLLEILPMSVIIFFSASKTIFFCRNDVQAIDCLRKGSYAPDKYCLNQVENEKHVLLYCPYLYFIILKLFTNFQNI